MEKEPLKKEDIIRGMIINADEYKTDKIISQNKIVERWVNTENLISAVGWLKENLDRLGATDDLIIGTKKIDLGSSKEMKEGKVILLEAIRTINKFIDEAFQDVIKNG